MVELYGEEGNGSGKKFTDSSGEDASTGEAGGVGGQDGGGGEGEDGLEDGNWSFATTVFTLFTVDCC